jgi:HK97 family phage major capsid protein
MNQKLLTQLTEEFETAKDEVRTAESRNLDPATRSAAIAKAMNLKARIDQMKADGNMIAEIGRITDRMYGATRGGGIGAKIVASEMGQWLLKNRGKFPSSAWTSPASELPMGDLMATTLDESTGSGGPVLIPQYVPGILPLPQRPLVVADLIGQGVADSNSIVYMREKTFTNAAAATSEGAAKPESTLVFEAITEIVRKIATFLPVSDELLEDVAAMTSYLNQRLSLGVNLALDDELLNGSGVAPHLTGFLQRAGLATAVARGAMTNADAILTQIAAIQNAVSVPPDGIIMHPTNWNAIQLLKDANGNYIGGFASGPFAAPHARSLWGLPVAITPLIAVGTALVGCFQTQAQLYRRGGLRVESTNSHSDFFQKNLIAIRAELRAALAVYRTGAFGTVTNLN